jgi:hypothetical protein
VTHAVSHLAEARKARLATLDPWRGAEAGRMTEDQLLTVVRQRIRSHSLWGYHTYRSDRSDKGFPDLVILGCKILYRELKTETGKLTPAQLDVINRLTTAGADADVWRPADLMTGRIDRELTALRHAPARLDTTLYGD